MASCIAWDEGCRWKDGEEEELSTFSVTPTPSPERGQGLARGKITMPATRGSRHETLEAWGSGGG